MLTDMFFKFDNDNLIQPLTGKSLWELVIEQFEDLLVRILLLAACISFVSNQNQAYRQNVFGTHKSKTETINRC